MKIIGILARADDGTEVVLPHTYGLVLSCDSRLDKPLPLEQFGLRHRRVLESAQILTFRAVLDAGEHAVARLSDFGRRGVSGLRELLAQEQLHFDDRIVEVE